jgi:hypothetical protein
MEALTFPASILSKQVLQPLDRLRGGVDAPKSAKLPPFFSKKARSAFLFYKFYKFRACN